VCVRALLGVGPAWLARRLAHESGARAARVRGPELKVGQDQTTARFGMRGRMGRVRMPFSHPVRSLYLRNIFLSAKHPPHPPHPPPILPIDTSSPLIFKKTISKISRLLGKPGGGSGGRWGGSMGPLLKEPRPVDKWFFTFSLCFSIWLHLSRVPRVLSWLHLSRVPRLDAPHSWLHHQALCNRR